MPLPLQAKPARLRRASNISRRHQIHILCLHFVRVHLSEEKKNTHFPSLFVFAIFCHSLAHCLSFFNCLLLFSTQRGLIDLPILAYWAVFCASVSSFS